MRNLADRLPPLAVSISIAILVAGCSLADLGVTEESIGSSSAGTGPTGEPDNLGYTEGGDDDPRSIHDDAADAFDATPADGAANRGSDVDEETAGAGGGSDGDDPEGSTADDAAPADPEEAARLERELSTDPNVVYRAGTCFTPQAPGTAPTLVGCSAPHTIEIYAVRQLPGDAGQPFLGLAEATALCDEDFRAITGVGIGLATVFNRSLLRPSEETWADGEREVVCYVAYPTTTARPLIDVDPVRAFGLVSVYGLRKGDCLIDFDQSATSFTLVECSEPHDAEVFVESAFDTADYPGDAAVDEIADQLCFGQSFEAFVGLDYRSSAVYSLRSRPSAETWAMGDRTINCILTDELVRTDSFEGSGL